jgi:glycosyltransferase involved in cell wall biosynthesis
MNLLSVTPAYFPFAEKGGPVVKVGAIAERLARGGLNVTVLTTTFDRSRAAGVSELRHVEVVYLSPLLRYRALTLNVGIFGFCRTRLREFDVVHIYGLYDLLGPGVARACVARGIPYVVEPMGMFRPIVRSLRLKRVYHRLFGQTMLLKASRVIATSAQERAELIAGGIPSQKILLRRNGVEVPESLPARGAFRRQWHVPEEAKLVLFLGRLVAKKSPELALEAFRGWRTRDLQRRSAVLVLAGPEEESGYRRKLELLSSQLGLNGAVIFPGPLFGDAKWAAYRDADVFILPSQSENFGNTAAEAIVCGTPALVTDRCGIAPLVDGRAGLVVPYDGAALEAGLARLLNDEGLRRQLQEGCAGVARGLTWKEPLAQMKVLYETLVSEFSRN